MKIKQHNKEKLEDWSETIMNLDSKVTLMVATNENGGYNFSGVGNPNDMSPNGLANELERLAKQIRKDYKEYIFLSKK